MNIEYYVLKALLTGLELNLTGMGLFKFVQSSTGCDLETFEKVYQELVQEAWTKFAA